MKRKRWPTPVPPAGLALVRSEFEQLAAARHVRVVGIPDFDLSPVVRAPVLWARNWNLVLSKGNQTSTQ